MNAIKTALSHEKTANMRLTERIRAAYPEAQRNIINRIIYTPALNDNIIALAQNLPDIKTFGWLETPSETFISVQAAGIRLSKESDPHNIVLNLPSQIKKETACSSLLLVSNRYKGIFGIKEAFESLKNPLSRIFIHGPGVIRQSPQNNVEELFKDNFVEVGKTFKTYLTVYRLNRAKILLKDPDITIKEVAGKTGYVNDTQFIRIFKKYEGLPPGDYRKTFMIETR